MGNLKAVFDSVLYAIMALTILYIAALFFGITDWFGMVFSFPGFIVACFLVFTLIAK